MGSFFKSLSRMLNPLVKPLFESGRIGVWGVVHHRGRRSGRIFATPVALGAVRDFFNVPLPYGEGTDWCRNLIAAHGGAISNRGHEYAVTEPRVVSVEAARSAFPLVLRPLLPIVTRKYLRLSRGGVAKHAA